MMVAMTVCFILHKTWNISTLFILCVCWEVCFCTVVAEHCFLCYYQKQKVMKNNTLMILGSYLVFLYQLGQFADDWD